MTRLLRRHLPQGFRRLVQFSALGFVLFAAYGGVWRNFKRAHNNDRLVELTAGSTAGWLYRTTESFLELFGESYEASLDFLGMPWASTVFGIESADPILVGSMALRGEHTPVGLFLGVVVPVVLAVVLGKVFCSHVCPMRLLFELGEFLRAGLLRLGISLPSYQSRDRYGGWILAGGLVAAILGGPVVWLFVLPYVSLSASIFMFVTASTVTGLFAVVAFWFFVDMLIAPGFFCHNLCPTGFLLEKLGRFRTLRLVTVSNERACPKNCEVCSMTCPYGISSKDGMTEPGCDNCGRCAVDCPLGKLGRRFGAPLVALLLVLVPAVANAHHNKGLPHYGYFENYPQVPTEEYVRIQGHYEIGAVIFNFQGYDDRANSDTPNDVKVYLYIYDLKNDQNYVQDVDFEIRKDGETVAEYLRHEVDEEAVYSTRETLPESGEYEIVAHLDDGTELRLPFTVDLDTDVDLWLIGAIAIPVALVFGLAVAGKRRGRLRNRGTPRRDA